jgi:type IV secretory pathway VirB3-like protein
LTLTARGSLALVLSFVVFVAIALPLDRSSTAAQQLVLSLLAWVFLAVALVLQPPAIRIQVIALVVLATLLECIGSLIWGAYTYRLENLPLYVPAGHGLFYLSALRTASLPFLQRRARAIVIAVTAGATAWMLYGLFGRPLPDLLGFVTWAIFIRFIVRGRYPLLYAVSFAMTTALELYGTRLGIWTWSPILPVLMLPAGNPPTGIGAGYAAMDALTRRIVARVERRRREPAAAEATQSAT